MLQKQQDDIKWEMYEAGETWCLWPGKPTVKPINIHAKIQHVGVWENFFGSTHNHTLKCNWKEHEWRMGSLVDDHIHLGQDGECCISYFSGKKHGIFKTVLIFCGCNPTCTVCLNQEFCKENLGLVEPKSNSFSKYKIWCSRMTPYL